MNSQFKKGILEMCILYIINSRDCYGYELVELMSKSISITENTVYPILRRLQEKEMCTTYLKESSGGAVRKYYTITNLGKKQLAIYLSEWKQFLDGVSKLIKEVENE
jgi:PadR family transcriptional regulator PadR